MILRPKLFTTLRVLMLGNLFYSEKKATSWREVARKDMTVNKSNPETVSQQMVTRFPESPQRNIGYNGQTSHGHKAHKTTLLLLLSWLQIQKGLRGRSFKRSLSWCLLTYYFNLGIIRLVTQKDGCRTRSRSHFPILFANKRSFPAYQGIPCGYFVRSNHCLKPVMQTTNQGRPQPEPGPAQCH